MTAGRDNWVDDEAGPLVRPYAMTRGRTRPANPDLNMITLVVAAKDVIDTVALDADYVSILELCHQPLSIAELAARMNVPIVVVKVLVSDLIEQREVIARNPTRDVRVPDMKLLQAVLDGVRRL
ncbi:DUF742 domain-containing protein [Kibdelosporangium philippinense]|uniref:DUF742 domain-containing protein n=1 Tax=Kibdelosporangium philippinense TaxID=211113 RepID=A0ABS8ZPM4_9PSEU|nr:DUF742 domain-containing protein [Kibdelosporangium philippinense]MCE7009709.1 DUF742 domain-containing protein [Kibdelosporangium philippinense]